MVQICKFLFFTTLLHGILYDDDNLRRQHGHVLHLPPYRSSYVYKTWKRCWSDGDSILLSRVRAPLLFSFRQIQPVHMQISWVEEGFGEKKPSWICVSYNIKVELMMCKRVVLMVSICVAHHRKTSSIIKKSFQRSSYEHHKRLFPFATNIAQLLLYFTANCSFKSL